MTEYRVSFHAGASTTITVEADDEEAALDKAYDALPNSICAQCSGWGQKWSRDIGEWEVDDKAPEVVKP